MQHYLLRATVCAACPLVGGAAFAQGVNYSTPRATRVAVHGTAIGGVGGMHGNAAAGAVYGNFSSGVRGNASPGIRGNFAINGMHGWRRHHWGHGYGGYGGGPGYAYGYPDYYDYGLDYDDPGYAYDYGYPNDTYAEGAYCQTPETSCPLDRPVVAGQACQCRNGVDEIPGIAQP